MEEAIKALKIEAKLLVWRSSGIWGILLATEEEAKTLAGIKRTTKNIRLETKYMGTRKTRVNLHGMPMYITVAIFSEYGPVDGVSSIKSDIVTTDFTGDIDPAQV